jgi:hypothetical protein
MSKYIAYVLRPGEEYIIGTHDQHSTDSRSRLLGHIMYNTQKDAEAACMGKWDCKLHGTAYGSDPGQIRLYQHAMCVKSKNSTYASNLTCATGWIARIA